MAVKIESVFRDLLGALQISKLYKLEHPMVQKALEKAFLSMSEALTERGRLVFGIIGEELTCEDEIFFELSALAQQAIHLFKAKGVEKIVFTRGMPREDLAAFLRYLAAGKDQALPEIGQYLKEQGVRTIEAGKITIGGKGGGSGHGSGGSGTGTGGAGSGGGSGTGTGGAGSGGPAGSGTGTGDAGGGQEGAQAWRRSGLAGGDPAQVYDSSLGGITATLTEVMNTEVVDHLMLRQGVGSILEGLTKRHRDFLKLVTLKRYHPTTFVHIMNVSVLSMFCAARLGFHKEDTIEIGVAGLFHDIGKLQISRQLLGKAGKLTDEEFHKMRSHTVYGTEILLEYVDTLGILPAVAAFEHHLKYDLTGYPRSRFNQKPHTASCIIAICDVYDALNQRRSYKQDYPPDEVYAIMQKEKGSAFSPELCDQFYRFVGVWPIGCVLELSDGSMAVVRDTHEDAIFLPVVEVIKPERRQELIDLQKCQDTLRIARFVNPWKEGKELLSFV